MDGAGAIGAGHIDSHIGLKVRARRQEIRLSLEGLAAAIGVSYQQVQKYETGANRISASTLYEIARVLRTPVAYFYAELPPAGCAVAVSRVDLILATPGGRELVEAYLAMPRRLRPPFIALARGVADERPEVRLPTWR